MLTGGYNSLCPHSILLSKNLLIVISSGPLFWQNNVVCHSVYFCWGKKKGKKNIELLNPGPEYLKEKREPGHANRSHHFQHTVTAHTHALTHVCTLNKHKMSTFTHTHTHVRIHTHTQRKIAIFDISDILGKMHQWQITQTLPHADMWTQSWMEWEQS